MPISPKTALDLLEGKRIEIVASSDLSKDSRTVVSLDQQSVGRLSRMDALQGQAMAEEAERRRVLELQRIEQAVKRLEQGDFGYCIECDAEISLKRLEIDPAASHCIRCAELLEKQKKK
ncbi:TraR/DksA family transcriptional regulator [Cohaesibacter celericrescens]|uniref:Molecular chaperone DnaK n=1 Tax=Cohaesibacter celericrescens TaxID=2067669 RepID=A0A2N5XSD7_9HYPH|nr:TraR/DksA C4-type zinc finger protein [Cohaesibacter celericrescens]PLW77357.1 molecular chaperone DnaK [Cohaesibacter celericrescens]